MDTLQRHMPVAGQDGVDELLKIAWRFEEKIFQAATDQVSLCFPTTQVQCLIAKRAVIVRRLPLWKGSECILPLFDP